MTGAASVRTSTTCTLTWLAVIALAIAGCGPVDRLVADPLDPERLGACRDGTSGGEATGDRENPESTLARPDGFHVLQGRESLQVGGPVDSGGVNVELREILLDDARRLSGPPSRSAVLNVEVIERVQLVLGEGHDVLLAVADVPDTSPIYVVGLIDEDAVALDVCALTTTMREFAAWADRPPAEVMRELATGERDTDEILAWYEEATAPPDWEDVPFEERHFSHPSLPDGLLDRSEPGMMFIEISAEVDRGQVVCTSTSELRTRCRDLSAGTGDFQVAGFPGEPLVVELADEHADGPGLERLGVLLELDADTVDEFVLVERDDDTDRALPYVHLQLDPLVEDGQVQVERGLDLEFIDRDTIEALRLEQQEAQPS